MSFGRALPRCDAQQVRADGSENPAALLLMLEARKATNRERRHVHLSLRLGGAARPVPAKWLALRTNKGPDVQLKGTGWARWEGEMV